MTYPVNKLLQLSNEEYHAAPGLGSSSLRDFIVSPLLYAERHVHKTMPSEDSSYLQLGSVIDSIILEPAELDRLVSLIPAEVLNKDGHRKGSAWTDWSASQGRKLLVKSDEWDDIRRMVDCVWACQPAIELLGQSMKQQAVFWQDSAEVLGKCKFDGVWSNGFFDLKTTAEPLSAFHYSVRKYNYLTQLAWYCYGFQAAFEQWPDTCQWLVVSKEKPYECMVMDAPDGLQDWADRKITAILEQFISYRKSHDWHNRKYDAPVKLDMDLSLYGGY